MALTSSCGIFDRNRADEATLSWGSWSAGLPLANLQTTLLAQVARTADATNSSTRFRIAFSQSRPVNLVALCRHNLSLDAQYRIRLYTDNTWATVTVINGVAIDSGVLDVWPPFFTTDDLEWEDDNWWSGRINDEDRAGYPWHLPYLLPDKTYGQYWQVEIFDTGNPDGYVEIGRLFIGDGWQPGVNMALGAAVGFETGTAVAAAKGGAEYFDVQAGYRVTTFALKELTENEAWGRAFDAQRRLGIHGEVFFIWSPDDTLQFIRRSFLARMRKLTPIEQPYQLTYATSYELKERQ